MADTSSAPAPSGRGLRGDRALAVRIIAETGARAAGRPFAEALHPPSRRFPLRIPLQRVPGDVVRRAMRRVDRWSVRHLGGLLLALRRVDTAEAVDQLHRLDHRCSALEHRLTTLEGECRRRGSA